MDLRFSQTSWIGCPVCYITYCFVFREDIQKLAKENDTYEDDVKDLKEKHRLEKRNKEKLDRVLYDAACSLRLALGVKMLR